MCPSEGWTKVLPSWGRSRCGAELRCPLSQITAGGLCGFQQGLPTLLSFSKKTPSLPQRGSPRQVLLWVSLPTSLGIVENLFIYLLFI
jgi:hypothetical protein